MKQKQSEIRKTFCFSRWKSRRVLVTHVALTTMSAYGIPTLTLTLVYTVAMMPTTPQPVNHPRYFPVNVFISACALCEQRGLLSLILFFFLSSAIIWNSRAWCCCWLISISSPAEHPPPVLSFFSHRDHSCIEYSIRHRIIRGNKLKT